MTEVTNVTACLCNMRGIWRRSLPLHAFHRDHEALLLTAEEFVTKAG